MWLGAADDRPWSSHWRPDFSCWGVTANSRRREWETQLDCPDTHKSPANSASSLTSRPLPSLSVHNARCTATAFPPLLKIDTQWEQCRAAVSNGHVTQTDLTERLFGAVTMRQLARLYLADVENWKSSLVLGISRRRCESAKARTDSAPGTWSQTYHGAHRGGESQTCRSSWPPGTHLHKRHRGPGLQVVEVIQGHCVIY